MNLRQRMYAAWHTKTLEPGCSMLPGPYGFAWGAAARAVLWMLENNGKWPTGEASALIHGDHLLIGDALERIREIETMPLDGWTYSHGPLSCPRCPDGYRFHKDTDPGYVWCNHCFHRGTVAEFEAAHREVLEMYDD